MASTFVLVPSKADPFPMKRGCKRCAIGASGASGIEMILTLLTEVVALPGETFRNQGPVTWLSADALGGLLSALGLDHERKTPCRAS